MSKKCIGCGIELQDTNKDLAGYTPDINKKYCMRCFKLTNYNELIDSGVKVDNEKLIRDINKKKSFVIFLVDFLNIYDEVIAIYKKIKNDKMLVITKGDLIPNNIVKKDLINNIKDIYDIGEEILLTSSVNRDNISMLTKLIVDHGNVLMAGFTNAGKSSIINALVGTNITVSKRANTTQDFIKLNIDGVTLYDAPGFMSNYYYDNKLPSKEVKPISYQIKDKYYLRFTDFNLYFNGDTNITIYMNKTNIDKLRVKEDIKCGIVVPSNYDLVIKGMGFIKFSKSCYIHLNMDNNMYEIRPSIIGGKNE